MAKKKTEDERLDEAGLPIPATQEKASAEYADDEPMTKAANKGGTAAFDGEEGLRARNATMEPDAVKSEGQTGTASKAKRG